MGTVRDLVNASGQIVNHLVYDAFGNRRSETNPQGGAVPFSPQLGFTGQLFDMATGLQYNHHRWYDPAAGRWLSEDPISFAAGDGNLYRYVGNQVTVNVDPSGLVPGNGTLQYVLAQAVPVTAALAKNREAFDKLMSAAQKLQTALSNPRGQQAIQAAQKAFEAARQNLQNTSHGVNSALQRFNNAVASEVFNKLAASSPQVASVQQASTQILNFTAQSQALQQTLSLGSRFNQLLTKIPQTMGTCEQTASALGNAVPAGTKVEYLEVFVRGGGILGQNGQTVSFGPHYVVRINNVIYDAFNRLGTPYAQWFNSLETGRNTTQIFDVIPRTIPPLGG